MKKLNPQTGLLTKTVSLTDHEATGAFYRRYRADRVLSISAVATKMKVRKQFLSDLERGRRGWTEQRAKAFMDAVEALSK